MKRIPLLSAAVLGLALAAVSTTLPAQTPQGTTGTAAASLKPAITLPGATTNGVAIAPDGRTFLVIQKQKGQEVPQVAEYVHGQLKPYPDLSWNQWYTGDDASHKFVHANSIRFGPDGTLWVVDFGSTEMYKSVVKHGPKLVGINIATGKVVNTTYFDGVTKPQSLVDDVRFHGDHAYLTDGGWPGLIVLNLRDGSMYRVLNDQPSTRAEKPLFAEGHQLENKEGKPIYFGADQLEVSPDGQTFYWQPCSGPLYSIPTAALDDKNLSDSQRASHIKRVVDNGAAGGTAIDSQGNIYVSDTQHNAVLKVTPQGQVSTLVQDPRLVWVDAMWITADGRLWMPAAQMDRTPGFNDGKQALHFPMTVFTANIGNGPSPIDHK